MRGMNLEGLEQDIKSILQNIDNPDRNVIKDICESILSDIDDVLED